ncbi:hypothetical protein ACHMWN_04155 [Pedobacter sp. UC225_61]|uniref:hypothetical protein n=1 Tax=Pedobacter sp. UC225_61 TaxID=3374623 RepID=UPI0037B5AF60
MKLNILFFILLTLSFTKLKAQTKTITIVSFNDNKPLQNVLIYYKADIIGETDKTGKVILRLNLVDSLTLVKNEYIDVVLAKNQLSETVTLKKNQAITLNEVVITPMNAKTLLKKITNFFHNRDEDGI